MNAFNPTCYNCGKHLKNAGLNNNGFPKFKKCNCLKTKQNEKIRAINNVSLQDVNGEIWKDIIDYEGLYKISNYGRVKSLRRLYTRVAWVKYTEEIILKIHIHNIRILVNLSKKAVNKNFEVKELVATHFVLNPNNFSKVININGDRLNNRFSNLEWVE